jgi:hypothetical protein
VEINFNVGELLYFKEHHRIAYISDISIQFQEVVTFIYMTEKPNVGTVSYYRTLAPVRYNGTTIRGLMRDGKLIHYPISKGKN